MGLKIEDNYEAKSKDFGQMEGGKMLEIFKFQSLEVAKLRETCHQVKWMSQSKPQIKPHLAPEPKGRFDYSTFLATFCRPLWTSTHPIPPIIWTNPNI